MATVAVLLNVTPLPVAAGTFTTKTNAELVFDARLGFVQVIVPLVPTGGVTHAHPAGATNDTNVSVAGSGSVSTTLAALKPELLAATVKLYVTLVPGTTVLGVAVATGMLRSTSAALNVTLLHHEVVHHHTAWTRVPGIGADAAPVLGKVRTQLHRRSLHTEDACEDMLESARVTGPNGHVLEVSAHADRWQMLREMIDRACCQRIGVRLEKRGPGDSPGSEVGDPKVEPSYACTGKSGSSSVL